MEIIVKGIRKKYGKKEVLKDCSFSVQGGSCIGILGENGCGKSTLLSILAGVQRADGGSFLLNGTDLFRNPKLRQKLVGYVPQGDPLLEELSARDNLLLWYDRKTMEQELAHGVLARLGIGAFLKMPVHKLSGGMKKRLSIACAVASQPPVLLLDEPMSALDLSCKKEIYSYIAQRKALGGIMILVTHDILELKLCDVCYMLPDGCLVKKTSAGSIDELMESL